MKQALTQRQILALKGPGPDAKSNTISYSTGYAGLRVDVSSNGNGRYACSFTIKGKKHSKNIGRVDKYSLKEAIAASKAYYTSLTENEYQESRQIGKLNQILFSDFAAKYIKEHSAIHNKSTRDDESKLRNGLLDWFGSLYMHEVNVEIIELFLIELSKRLSPASVNRYRALLSSMFTKAIAWKMVESNPVSSIKKLPENNEKTDFLKHEDAEMLFKAMKDEKNRVAVLAIKFLLFTGLRLNEALTATWEHVDCERGSLYLPDTKSGKSRTVFLNDAAIEVINELKTLKTGKYVFPGKDQNSHYVNVTKVFNRNLKRCGLPHFRLHMLRHSYCSWLAMDGVPLMHIQKLVGHASPAMTMRYAHLADKTLINATQRISGILKQHNIDGNL